MDEICRQHHLLTEERGVVRVPFLVKGKLVLPPEMGWAEVASAFAGTDRGSTWPIMGSWIGSQTMRMNSQNSSEFQSLTRDDRVVIPGQPT